MDVYGINPVMEKGEYFRNNVWFWRPLWEYCESLYPPCQDVSGHTNDGEGLNAEQARELAAILLEEVRSGRTKAYQDKYEKEIAELPRQECDFCKGVGIVQVQESWPDYVEGEVTFRDPCNGCNGEKTKPHWASHYPFHVDNVIEFAEFCQNSGGFQIC